MLNDIDRLRAERDRVLRPHRVAITPAPGGSPVEAAPGDELVIAYDGEARHVRVLAVMPWGIRAWDLDKQATRSFRYEKICQGKARETDGAAQG